MQLNTDPILFCVCYCICKCNNTYVCAHKSSTEAKSEQLHLTLYVNAFLYSVYLNYFLDGTHRHQSQDHHLQFCIFHFESTAHISPVNSHAPVKLNLSTFCFNGALYQNALP